MVGEDTNWITPDVLKSILEPMDKEAAKIRLSRQKLLLDLANIDGNSARLNKFLGRFNPSPSPAVVATIQNQLRSVWHSPVEALSLKNPIIEEWLFQATRQTDHGAGPGEWNLTAFVPNWRTGQIEFVPSNFLGQLVTAVLENWRRFRVCLNPDCPARFFFAKRSTSVVCERGDCSKYAQQQHALRWWWRKKHQKEGAQK